MGIWQYGNKSQKGEKSVVILMDTIFDPSCDISESVKPWHCHGAVRKSQCNMINDGNLIIIYGSR